MRNSRNVLPSGIRSCWGLWRHCCCRFGFYPLAIAPILTLAFLLSAYSSLGCQFIEVEVGFTPSNQAWNKSQADLGLFYHFQQDAPEYNMYRQWVQEECVPYSNNFEELFVDQDRTWKVARIMAMVAAAAGGLSALVSWMMVVLPLPVGCLWPGLLLPGVMIAFIAEGSKFLFFDIALCRSPLWFPSGVDSLPTAAESCVLGPSALSAIAAGAMQLVGLLLVCLKAPEKRELDPDFGVQYSTGAEVDLEEASSHGDARNFVAAGAFPTAGPQDRRNTKSVLSAPVSYDEYEEETSVLDEEDEEEAYTSHSEDTYSASAPSKPDSVPLLPLDLPTVEKPPKQDNISESRLSAMSRMEQNASMANPDEDLLVEQLVSDLDSSFQQEETNGPSDLLPPVDRE